VQAAEKPQNDGLRKILYRLLFLPILGVAGAIRFSLPPKRRYVLEILLVTRRGLPALSSEYLPACAGRPPPYDLLFLFCHIGQK
jgi:hypothetical protein